MFISVCDAKSGFWQLLVRPQDLWKCAFVTHHGVWTWKRMPFGLRNAPANFVKAIRKVLFPIREHSDAYVDDTQSVSHFQIIWSIFVHFLLSLRIQVLRWIYANVNLHRLQPDLLDFWLEMDKSDQIQKKIEVIMNLKLPETLTQLRTTLGVLNFYRSHIPDFADIAKPLTDAMSSGKTKVHFQLGESAKVAFEKLKKLVCTAPVLVPPKFGEPFLL